MNSKFCIKILLSLQIFVFSVNLTNCSPLPQEVSQQAVRKQRGILFRLFSGSGSRGLANSNLLSNSNSANNGFNLQKFLRWQPFSFGQNTYSKQFGSVQSTTSTPPPSVNVNDNINSIFQNIPNDPIDMDVELGNPSTTTEFIRALFTSTTEPTSTSEANMANEEPSSGPIRASLNVREGLINSIFVVPDTVATTQAPSSFIASKIDITIAATTEAPADEITTQMGEEAPASVILEPEQDNSFNNMANDFGAQTPNSKTSSTSTGFSEVGVRSGGESTESSALGQGPIQVTLNIEEDVMENSSVVTDSQEQISKDEEQSTTDLSTKVTGTSSGGYFNGPVMYPSQKSGGGGGYVYETPSTAFQSKRSAVEDLSWLPMVLPDDVRRNFHLRQQQG